jgi:hypothetical protein
VRAARTSSGRPISRAAPRSGSACAGFEAGIGLDAATAGPVGAVSVVFHAAALRARSGC